MRTFARLSLGLMGLALVAPGVARAGDDAVMSGGYRPIATAPAPVPVQPTAPAPYTMPASAPVMAHQHNGKAPHLCASCMREQQLRMAAPTSTIGCAHKRDGLCPACQAQLDRTGSVVISEVAGPAVVVSEGAPGAPGRAMVSDAGMVAPGDPAPIGEMRTSYEMARPGVASTATAPKPAPVRMAPASAPFLPPSRPTRVPVISHLLGFGDIGKERREAKARAKMESHASIAYGPNGEAPTDVPASVVFGKKGRTGH